MNDTPAVTRGYSSAAIALGLVLLAAGATFVHFSVLARAKAETTKLSSEMSLVKDRLASAEAENENLRTALSTAASENKAFGERVAELMSTVGYLDKLSKTDRELLQKYSAVYFLSDNYVPEALSPISDELLLRQGTNAQFHTKAYPFLAMMMQAAEGDNRPLKILSAYRSFGEQSSLKSNYKLVYGTGANKFSADQGYSEHQLGTTVDFTTSENGANLDAFGKTQQYAWLISHAHEYGFVLSYPDGNSYFQFEPWHWRFVGVDLAKRMYNENKYFYDLDQREIDPYLGRIFD